MPDRSRTVLTTHPNQVSHFRRSNPILELSSESGVPELLRLSPFHLTQLHIAERVPAELGDIPVACRAISYSHDYDHSVARSPMPRLTTPKDQYLDSLSLPGLPHGSRTNCFAFTPQLDEGYLEMNTLLKCLDGEPNLVSHRYPE